jgi:hypothetical protein
VILVGSLGCVLNACTGDSDQARSVAGPGVSVHCAAEHTRLAAAVVPGNGDTTVSVRCPPAAQQVQGVDP